MRRFDDDVPPPSDADAPTWIDPDASAWEIEIPSDRTDKTPSEPSSVSFVGGWPEIDGSILEERRAPPFPIHALPRVLGVMVEEVSRASQTPPDFAACMGLATAAVVAQRKFTVEIHPDHYEPANLWIVSLGISGTAKGFVESQMTAPLRAIEAEDHLERGEEVEERLAAIEIQEKRVQMLKDLEANPKKAKGSEQVESWREARQKLRELQEAFEPSLDLTFDDVTPEKLGAKMHQQDGFGAHLSSEIGNLVSLFSPRYNKSSTADLMLRSYPGEPWKSERLGKGRELVRIDKPSISIGVLPQPGPWRDFASTRDFINNGLINRFLVSYPKSLHGYREIPLDPADLPRVSGSVTRAWAQAIRTIWERLDYRQPRGFSPPAWKEILSFRRELEPLYRPGGKYESIFSFASKANGFVPRLALLHSCLAGFECWSVEEERESVRSAIEIVRYFLDHRLLLQVADPAADMAQRVVAWVRAQGRAGEWVSQRDLLRRFSVTLEELHPAMVLLEQGGFVRGATRRPETGRPQPGFEISPRLRQN